ncbi:MAG: lysophospholipid acyltransferase family protein [Actinomycetota bacterium]|jgi:1-acyl-sn-glycerol-3-phosphate acyltransferase|nr:lysophospholipid acyltransferase family protein [Actinomycetota bacterium]
MSAAPEGAGREGAAKEGAGREGAGREAARPEGAAREFPFALDTRRTLPYLLARLVFTTIVGGWFRPIVTGRDHVPLEGPAIIAPVHRSFADFAFSAFLTRRKLFFMAKDELWRSRALGRLLAALGAFPVHREAADREALRRAQEVLCRGQLLVLFPEGTRRSGETVAELHEGAAFLAARTGAPIVPVGIGGSDVSMPKGRRIPKRLRIRVVVGEPIPPPARSAHGRVPRSHLHATTEALRAAIQAVYDEARGDFEQG